jgi:hypothetical protein
LLRDLAFAARALRRSPVFTLTAALTIALGIGASTAIFSVANAVLLRPLPDKNPQQLVVLYADLRARDNPGMPLSAENHADVRNGTKGAFTEDALRLSAAGIGAGVIAALMLTRLMTTMLVGITPTDPLTFGAMASGFVVIAALSSWLPARRAAALDPTVALRN